MTHFNQTEQCELKLNLCNESIEAVCHKDCKKIDF